MKITSILNFKRKKGMMYRLDKVARCSILIETIFSIQMSSVVKTTMSRKSTKR
jgi:hypothetical protein